MADLLNRHVLPDWPEADAERWARIAEASDDELWRVQEQGRERLVAFVRARAQGGGGQARRLELATWPGPTTRSTPTR